MKITKFKIIGSIMLLILAIITIFYCGVHNKQFAAIVIGLMLLAVSIVYLQININTKGNTHNDIEQNPNNNAGSSKDLSQSS
ncbi:MAG: hypothetical protein K6F27_10920 [Ruminococcus sp.]|nr:hypothetical protein [Ruminococcus sp.]